MDLTKTPEWQALLAHKVRLQDQHLRDLFAQDEARFAHFSVEIDGLLVDYSKQRIDRPSLASLIDLAKSAQLEHWRDRMFAGEKINFSENRAVLHTALRHTDFTRCWFLHIRFKMMRLGAGCRGYLITSSLWPITLPFNTA